MRGRLRKSAFFVPVGLWWQNRSSAYFVSVLILKVSPQPICDLKSLPQNAGSIFSLQDIENQNIMFIITSIAV
jgi:hypothetical protein